MPRINKIQINQQEEPYELGGGGGIRFTDANTLQEVYDNFQAGSIVFITGYGFVLNAALVDTVYNIDVLVADYGATPQIGIVRYSGTASTTLVDSIASSNGFRIKYGNGVATFHSRVNGADQTVRIDNLTNPSDGNDAATKSYVDSAISTLQSTVNSHTTTINSHTSSINTLNSQNSKYSNMWQTIYNG